MKPSLIDEVYMYQATGEASIDLYESYSILGGSIITQYVGSWSEENGLEIVEEDIWVRRENLRGTEVTTLPTTYLYLTGGVHNSVSTVNKENKNLHFLYFWRIPKNNLGGKIISKV